MALCPRALAGDAPGEGEGVRRITCSGQRKRVTFHLAASSLATTAMDFVIEPGTVEVMVTKLVRDIALQGPLNHWRSHDHRAARRSSVLWTCTDRCSAGRCDRLLDMRSAPLSRQRVHPIAHGRRGQAMGRGQPVSATCRWGLSTMLELS